MRIPKIKIEIDAQIRSKEKIVVGPTHAQDPNF